ncbi:MAG: cytochrome c3 family protein [Phycisphaerae bacterium]
MHWVLVIVAAAVLTAAAMRGGGIVGSKHDFSELALGHGQVCQPCHHPHTPTGDVPLWAPSPQPPEPLRLYETVNRQLAPSDLMCLSCHDGAIAADISGGTDDVVVTQIGWSRAAHALRIGAQAGNHPIGVPYPSHERKYHPRAAVTADQLIKLPEGRVSCLSCHDPHATAGHEAMLVKSNKASRLCLSCHDL